MRYQEEIYNMFIDSLYM